MKETINNADLTKQYKKRIQTEAVNENKVNEYK